MNPVVVLNVSKEKSQIQSFFDKKKLYKNIQEFELIIEQRNTYKIDLLSIFIILPFILDFTFGINICKKSNYVLP